MYLTNTNPEILQKTSPQLELFTQRLPDKPYTSNDLGYGLRVLPKRIAKTMKYIQHNKPWDTAWMVYDVDRPSSSVDWIDRSVPGPNIVATNPENGHSHLFYALGTPVHLYDFSSKKTKNYAAAIDYAVTRELEADQGYTKLISKNPLHDHWIVQTFQTVPYDLDWMADWLDLPAPDGRRNPVPVGIGRNVTLFRRTAKWAYSAIKKPDWLSFDMWRFAVESKCKAYNDFLIPLPYQEVQSVTKSVAGWVWNNMSPQGFIQWCSRRGKASGRARAKKAKEKLQKVLEALQREPGASQRRLAEITGIPQRTVSDLLNL
jgi:hypothetical protein